MLYSTQFQIYATSPFHQTNFCPFLYALLRKKIRIIWNLTAISLPSFKPISLNLNDEWSPLQFSGTHQPKCFSHRKRRKSKTTSSKKSGFYEVLDEILELFRFIEFFRILPGIKNIRNDDSLRFCIDIINYFIITWN